MKPTTSLSRAVGLAAALACLLLPASALAATHENQQAYEKQLAAREIEKARINKQVRHLDITLKNGQQFTYVYAAHDEPAVAAKLAAGHVPLEVLSPTAAKAEAKKGAVHHKLRYIAAGILGAIVIIVLIVLFVDRRRKRFAE
jgi:hypothetical protein